MIVSCFDYRIYSNNLSGSGSDRDAWFYILETFLSIQITAWTLERLKLILDGLNYSETNLLSMMTLSIEHFHATTHFKQPLMTQLQYAREFLSSVKESVKRSCLWAAYYFTSRKGSWYPPAENEVELKDLIAVFPTKQPYPTIKEKEAMLIKDWASTYTRAVRQRTVRQETTMAKMGTLPHYLYSLDRNKQAKQTIPFSSVSSEDRSEEDPTGSVPDACF